jgi:hypothetical protein
MLEELARGLPLTDGTTVFGGLVHSAENERLPVHRWYQYKEAFSPRLPLEVLARYGAGRSGVVVDSFAGVATTQLALASDPRVTAAIGVEYSPFAHFVGRTKLAAIREDPRRLAAVVGLANGYAVEPDLTRPSLSSLSDERIYAPRDLDALLSAKGHIAALDVSDVERGFLLLGLIGAADDVSGVIKDGRALRIAGNGHRKRPGIASRAQVDGGPDRVRSALATRWRAMVEDVEDVDRAATGPRTEHRRGDARELAEVPAIEPEAVGLFVSSPPYLNTIDYTEVYKLELWLLGFVDSADAFRTLRLGTLRSHPSVEFPDRPYLAPLNGTPIGDCIVGISSFLEGAHARASIGRVARHYFADLFEVLRQQYRALEPGGHAVLVVGNSMFSSRQRGATGAIETWRLPILTDVIAARLAEAAGFVSPEVIVARALRARNVTAGASRESLVVLRKPAA